MTTSINFSNSRVALLLQQRLRDRTSVECLVDDLLEKMEFGPTSSILFNNNFVVKHSKRTKVWRKEMKDLLDRYLSLKFSEQKEDYLPLSETRVIRFRCKGRWYAIQDAQMIWEEKRQVSDLSHKECRIFNMEILSRIFNGASLENVHIELVDSKSEAFWENWKSMSINYQHILSYLPEKIQTFVNKFFLPTHSWVEYVELIHPILMQAALKILNCSSEKPEVVEICGGEGELAQSIVDNFGRPLKYYLLEYNDCALRNAERKKRFSVIKTDVTNCDDYFYDRQKRRPMERGSVDLIIGSGALTAYVLKDEKAAFNVAKKCFELLKVGGKMVLSGHAESLLQNRDFNLLGFKVLNSFDLRVYKQLYILEKM